MFKFETKKRGLYKLSIFAILFLQPLSVIGQASQQTRFLGFYSAKKQELKSDEEALYKEVMGWVEKTGEEIHSTQNSSETAANAQYQAMLIALSGVKREAYRKLRDSGAQDTVDRRIADRLYRQFSGGAYAHIQTEWYCGHAWKPGQGCQEEKYRGSSRGTPRAKPTSPFSY